MAMSAFDLFAREDCVVCPDTPLECPVCPRGQTCVQVTMTCQQCASRQCVPSGESGLSVSKSSGPNIGAIAGGVVGGIVFIAIIIYLVWRFYLKPRRQREHEVYEKALANRYASSMAGSDRTRASMATTVNTRSSNVIQIAFIPGVTDRSDGAYTPPVPAVPTAHLSPYTDASGDHYFMPGDLRDSTYSGFTDDGASTIGRQSIAPSIAPSLLRQSVASTIYHEVHAPAQTVQRVRPNMVTVKSASPGATTPLPPIPAVPKIDMERFGPLHKKEEASPAQTLPSIQITSDSASEKSGLSANSAATLQSAITQAAWRASQQPTHGGFGTVTSRDPSPFSDENQVLDSSTPSTPRAL